MLCVYIMLLLLIQKQNNIKIFQYFLPHFDLNQV